MLRSNIVRLSGFLGDTWVMALVAIDFSLLVNVVSDFDGQLISLAQIGVTLMLTVLLCRYCVVRTLFLSSIENEMEKSSRQARAGDIGIDASSVFAICERHRESIPVLFRCKWAVPSVSIIAVLFIMMTNSYQTQVAAEPAGALLEAPTISATEPEPDRETLLTAKDSICQVPDTLEPMPQQEE